MYKQRRNLAIVLIFFIMVLFSPQTVMGAVADYQKSIIRVQNYYKQQPGYNEWEALGLRSSGMAVGDKTSFGDLQTASDYARTILGSIAAGSNQQTVAQYVYNLQQMQQATGDFSHDKTEQTLNQTIWAIIALDFAQANEFKTVYNRSAATDYLISQQDSGGGFNESGYGVDVDSTAHALIALAPYKTEYVSHIDQAIGYLKSQQFVSGGFGGWGSENSDSTAVVIEALIALGQDPKSTEWTMPGDKNMVQALLSYQNIKGWFVNSLVPSDWNDPTVPNPMSTRNALLALSDLKSGKAKYHNLLPVISGGGGGSVTPPVTPVIGKNIAAISIQGDRTTGTILPYTVWHWEGPSTVLNQLRTVLDDRGISYNISSDGYVSMIGGLTHKKEGYPLSGWLFKVNNVFSNAGTTTYILNNGDEVEWVYTMDGGKDAGNPQFLIPEELIPDEVELKVEQPSIPVLENPATEPVNVLEYLTSQGIIRGTDKGMELDRFITRAELIQVLTNAAKITPMPARGQVFTDVNTGDWFAAPIETAAARKFVHGYPDGSFKPQQLINRYEIACLLDAWAGNSGKSMDLAKDEQIPAWARTSVARGIAEGWIIADDQRFNGEDYCQRAQVFEMVYRWMNNHTDTID
ncbi:MAG: S-layer homology domain-containing protein [Syntrophomonadaceae bacterium]